MDALSQFLALFTPRASLDARCNVSAPWELTHEHEARGVASWHVVVSGSATLTVGAADHAPVLLRAGDIVVLPHGSAHRLHAAHGATASSGAAAVHARADSAATWHKTNMGPGPASDILCGRFTFDEPAGCAVFAAMPALLLVRTADNPEFTALQALCTMLRTESEGMRPGAAMLVTQLSAVLFALLVRAWTEQAAGVQGVLGVLAERRLQPALLGMFARLDKPFTLAEMARCCHMSRATFVRLFQQKAQAAPAATLQQLRMAQASRWLSDDNRPVSSISAAVGYQSEAAFSRAFKKCFGASPGNYRRQFRAGAAL